MDDNERLVKIEELKKAREELLKEIDKQNDERSQESQNQNSFVKTIGTGNVTGGLNMYPVYDDKKAGMTNVVTLAILSFVFECLFIGISFMLFK